jgi:hypothetical protein
MKENHVSEQRLTKRLSTYWEKLKGDDVLPDFDKLNPEAIDDIWGNCFVVLISGSAEKRIFIYEYMGDDLIAMYGRDLTGERASVAIRSIPGSQVLEKMTGCIEAKTPLVEQGQFMGGKDKLIKYRSCLLPFGTKEGIVTRILAGISWNAY